MVAGGVIMPDYKEMCLKMVRATEKAIRAEEETLRTLIEAQRECEELYLSAPEPELKIVELLTHDQQ